MKERCTIEARNLSIGYPEKKGRWKVVHSDMDFNLYSGELTCLIGLNGTGKSTLIRTMCRFQPAISGTISVFGRKLEDYSMQEFSLTIGAVLTEKTFAGGMTVYDLVSLGRHPHTGFFGVLKDKDRNIIEKAMKSVGIDHKAGSFVAELSDGERQRVMIAKVLAQECPVIILDEPTAFLDVAARMETMALLRKTAVDMDKTIILSTHDIENALMYGDKLMLLSNGDNLHYGSPEDLIISGELSDFFSKRGLDFDRITGHLSIGTHDRLIGVDGDGFISRWMSNALFRNGYSPSSPSENTTNVLCRSQNDIEISFTNGKNVTVSGISQAVKNILDHDREESRGEK